MSVCFWAYTLVPKSALTPRAPHPSLLWPLLGFCEVGNSRPVSTPSSCSQIHCYHLPSLLKVGDGFPVFTQSNNRDSMSMHSMPGAVRYWSTRMPVFLPPRSSPHRQPDDGRGSEITGLSAPKPWPRVTQSQSLWHPTTCNPTVKIKWKSKAHQHLHFLKKSKGDPIQAPCHKCTHLLHFLQNSSHASTCALRLLVLWNPPS